MKFLLAIVAYLLIAGVLGWGILALVYKGSPWVLIVGGLAYLIMFAKNGCLPPKTHH